MIGLLAVIAELDYRFLRYLVGR